MDGRPVFIKTKRIIQSWNVVDDLTERRIVLVYDFNPILIKQESQEQYLLQVEEMHRKKIPQYLLFCIIFSSFLCRKYERRNFFFKIIFIFTSLIRNNNNNNNRSSDNNTS